MTGTDRSNLATCAGLGMLSGGVAWVLVKLLGNGSYTSVLKGGAVLEVNAFTVLPGLIFGLIIGFLWHRRGMISQLVVLGYALAAGVAFFLSFHIAFNIFDRLSGLSGPMREDAALVVSGIIAGLIACSFLGVVTAKVLRNPYQSALGLPVLVGGAAGALLPLINIFNEWDGGLLVFLVLWQGVYAAGLVRLLRPGAVALTRAASMGAGKSRT
jgi:hypothetical protein